MTGIITNDLPVFDCLSNILAAVKSGLPVVLKAPPGAGKTTGVPSELIRQNVLQSGQILLVQPRRLAARAAASQIANRLQTQVGGLVGYHVRFDKNYHNHTRLIAMTTGILLRRMTVDPLLENVSCVILDEFHERSLEVDLALGMLQRVRLALRPELRLMIMSATLDPEPLVGFLGQAEAVTSLGRSFPVRIEHSPAPSRQPIADQVVAILPKVLATNTGHILVFLPGVGEIRATRRAIQQSRFHNVADLYDLHGSMSPKDQDQVLRRSTTRKIILATNIAETSITIDGVTGVIDSGTARVMSFDTQVGLPKLQLQPISQASAEQRAGRAGRTEPGTCYRLWPEVSHRARREVDLPEIQRADFSGAMLTLAAWGERDVFDFPWLTPPTPQSVEAATLLLQRLDAIDQRNQITDLGQHMISLPLHPRLSRLVIEAAKCNDVQRASIAAALLTERDPFRDDASPSVSAGICDCDLLERIDRIRNASRSDRSTGNAAAIREVLRSASQIANLVQQPEQTAARSIAEPSIETFKRALLAAYPDRLARRRVSGDGRGIMVGGRGVKIDPESSCRGGELFLCLDVDSGGTEAKVRIASTIDQSWLDPKKIRTVDEPFFHPTLQAVVARRRRYFEDLMLGESPIACQPTVETAELLAKHAMTSAGDLFPSDDLEVNRFIQRVRFLVETLPTIELSPLDGQAVEKVLLELCQSRTSLAELRTAPWLDYLRGLYTYEQLQWIDQHAPAKLKVPSGNSITVHYAHGKRPWMEVKIQELFGLKSTPKLAAGTVPLQLHLLGPNQRPQQITEDLENFWKETYVVVRKELKRRYPKHHWPDDPTIASATARGLKPKA
jgi:ATP-dependent helicase HrpB